MITKPGTLSHVISLAALFALLGSSGTTAWSQPCGPAIFLSQTQNCSSNKFGFLAFAEDPNQTTNLLHLFLQAEIVQSVFISETSYVWQVAHPYPPNCIESATGTLASDVILLFSPTNHHVQTNLTGTININVTFESGYSWPLIPVSVALPPPPPLFWNDDYNCFMTPFYPESGLPILWGGSSLESQIISVSSPPGYIYWRLLQSDGCGNFNTNYNGDVMFKGQTFH